MTHSWMAAIAAPLDRVPNEHRPSKLLLALEARALIECACLPVALPWLLHRVPRGDGHAVLVVPGLLANDGSTLALRRFLAGRGYEVHGWRQGRNLGPNEGVLDRLRETLARLHAQSGRKVSVIGWSLGGIFAREIARAAPRQVRQVITMGSPLYGAPERSTNAWSVYRMVSQSHVVDEQSRGSTAPPVPTTSIYTRGDGVVGWGCSVERPGPMADNIEINGTSHMGMGFNALVWYAVGDRLAQPEDQWQHFAPRWPERALFPFRAPERT